MDRYTHTRARTHTHTHAHTHTHTHTHTAYIYIQPPYVNFATPTASAALRAPPKAAHTDCMFDNDAVFHLPMSALKADAELNVCEPHR